MKVGVCYTHILYLSYVKRAESMRLLQSNVCVKSQFVQNTTLRGKPHVWMDAVTYGSGP